MLAAGGAALYVATLVVVPLLNLDRDVLRLHPEDLYDANGGFLVIAGWLVFAVALAATAYLAWRRRGIAMRIAALCFVVAALVSVANAIDPTLGIRGSPIELGIFGLAIGPLVASFASRPVALRVLAVAAALAFAGIVFETAPVGGMVNRVFDALAGIWCVAFAVEARAG